MKRISLFILSACCLTAVQAQDNLNRTLTIEKDYAPSIRDANKINELPEVKTPEVVKSEVQFSEYTMPYTVSPYLVNFAPSPLFTDLEKSDKRGYLNLGVSTLLDVDADLGYQLIHTDRDFFSIYLSNNYSNSKMSFVQTDQKNRMKLHDLWGGFDYKHVFNKAVFDLGGKYTFSRFNYYGLFPYANYEEDRPAPSIEDILTRKYTKDNKINRILDVYAGVSSRDGADLNYRFSAAYTHFGTRTGWVNYNNKLSENRILLGLDLSKEFDATWTIGFNGQFNGRFYSLDKDISTEYHVLFDRDNRYALALNPYFYTSGTNWQLRVGLHAGFIMGDYEKANIAPDVYFSFNPSPVFGTYLKATGGVKENSLYSLSYENRYLGTLHALKTRDTRTPIDAVIGVKITPLPGFSMDFFAGYELIKDDLFYRPNLLSLRPFFPWEPYPGRLEGYLFGQQQSYIQNEVSNFKIGAEISYKYQNILNASLKGTYFHWKNKDKTDDYDGVWGRPSFKGDLNLGYNLSELPLNLQLNYHLEAGRDTYIYSGKVNMKDIHDLSVRGVYTINETVSVNASLNNLLFQKYDLWYGYPGQNFNLMAGISLKF